MYWRGELIQWGNFNAQPQTQAKPTYHQPGVASHGPVGGIPQLISRVVSLEERFENYISELEHRNAELGERNAYLEGRHAELEKLVAICGYPYQPRDNVQSQSFVNSQPSQQLPAFNQEP